MQTPLRTTRRNGLIISALFVLLSIYSNRGYGQSFSQSNLNFNGNGGVSQGTSLMFGPDGRLYVLGLKGQIDVFTIERNGVNDYDVTDAEEILSVLQIPNHDDDGSDSQTSQREATGLTVAGTAQNPVIYVTSSDPRVGGPSGDQDLDTNSGVITRLTWTGSTWDVVDMVRGLPRSEENHATNGLEFVTIDGTDYLIVCSGGHTNAGAPSDNFAWTTEYALSAAILSVNLTMLEGMEIKNDGGRQYIYDLPTLDDPTRDNANGINDPDTPGYDGIDLNDPWGGNDGLNQAKIVIGGPVQIFSPGYRNTYDLTVTADGKVYVTDNGANGGWGGLPTNEGIDGTVTNNYIASEPGSSSPVGGEQVNNADHLTKVTTDIQNYVFGSFYGGHPAPIRANPAGAGLFTNPEENSYNPATSVFRTLKYDPDGTTPGSTTDASIALPVDWPPVPETLAQAVQGDWRGPGINNPDGPNDNLVTTWGTNTNGLDEYTASNFGGAMQGDLIAGKNGGVLRRVQLDNNGDLQQLTNTFISNLGGNALGVTCNSDADPFPGTIWVAPFNGSIVVLEPQDFVICILPGEPGYDPTADNDSDGYTNQDEIDNKMTGQTDADVICNGGAQPNDFDKSAGGTLVSDLNDEDDDNDNIIDANDPFQLGDPTDGGSDAFNLPVENELFSDNPELLGYLGLGFTGLMNNGDANPNWLNWLDRRDDLNDPNPNDILGGAVGAMTMQMTAGTALGNSNNQEKGFQYGVQVDQSTGNFSIEGALQNFDDPLQLYGNAAPGELGIFMGDGTQSNYIKMVINKSGIEVLQEINDVPQTPIAVNIPNNERPDDVMLRFTVDPSTGEVTPAYALDNGDFVDVGTLTAQGAILTAIQNSNTPLAVGLIGSSNQANAEVEGTWDYLNVQGSQPTVEMPIPNIEVLVDAPEQVIDLDNFFSDDGGDNNLMYSIEGNTDNSIGASLNGSLLTLTFPSSAATSTITVRATDNDGLFEEQSFTVSVSDEPVPVARIRANGPTIPATDAGNPDWVSAGAGGAQSGSANGISFSVNTGNLSGFNVAGRDSSVPDYVPQAIFANERWDPPAAPEMEWTFDLTNGNYLVRLYMANGFGGTSAAGQRIFDIAIEGNLVENDLDLSGTLGHQVGGMFEYPVTLNDGTLNILFTHVVENPLVNGLEILSIGGPITPPIPPISVEPIANQSNLEGDLVNLTVLASGGSPNETFSYEAIGLPPGLQIEPTTGLIFGNIDAGAAQNSPYNSTVTVDKPSSTAVDVNFTWTVFADGNLSMALFEVTPGSNNINASTFGNGSFEITNNSPSANITSVTLDLSTGFIPNVVFDPSGTAGDQTAKGFTINTGVGGTVNHNFSLPLGNGGFQGLTMTFDDFNPGELFEFSVDQDPTSIEGLGAPGPGDSGSISGLEQSGSTVTVTFSDGATYTTSLYSDGSNGGATSKAKDMVLAAPIIAVQGLNSPATTNQASQTILISGGPANGTVSLLQVEGAFFEGGGDLNQEPFEVNSAVVVNRITGIQLDGSGAASVPVTLTDSDAAGGYNYFVAAAEDGSDFGQTSNTVILEYDDQFVPPIPPAGTVLYRINTGGAVVSATDAPNPDWSNDTGNFGANGNSQYLAALSTGTSTFNQSSGSAYQGNIDLTDPSLPAGILATLFQSERFDAASAPEMLWQFPVDPTATITVRLYFAELFSGIDAAGERVFDVSVEGVVPPVFDDIDQFERNGALGAFMLSHTLVVNDGTLDLEFIHVVQNPAVKAIEILSSGGVANEPPVVTNPGTQDNLEGDDVSLQISAADNQPCSGLAYEATGLPPGLTIDLNTGLITGQVEVGASATSPYAVTVTVSDGCTPALSSEVGFDWLITEPVGANPSAFITVNPGEGLNATTFGNSSFQITNTGNSNIVSVSVELSTSFLPDIVWDPVGTAGDSGAKCLTVGSEGGTGYVVPNDVCVDPFSVFHNGVDVEEGYDIVTLNFTDFNPDETFAFTADIDPTSIKNDVTTGDAGAVSGFELIGSVITITFADGTTLVSNLFDEGSLGGSQAILASDAPTAPTILVDGVITPALVFEPNQTILVSGNPNASITLLQVDARLWIDAGSPMGGYDIDPFEANEAMAKVLYTVMLDENGNGSIPVTLLKTATSNAGPDGGINHFIAVENGVLPDQTSLTSNVLVLEYSDEPQDTAPVIAELMDVDVDEGGNLTVALNVTDADGDDLTVTVTTISNEPQLLQSANSGTQVDPFPVDASGFLTLENEITAPGSYTAELVFTPTFGDGGGADGDGSGTYTISLEVSDLDGNVLNEDFILTVNDVHQLIPATGLFRIEAESFDNQGPANTSPGNTSDTQGIGVEVNDPGVTNIGFTNDGDFAEYLIEVEAAGTYQFDFAVAKNSGTANTMTINGGPAEITVANNGNWQEYSIVSAIVLLEEGQQTLRFDWSGPAGFFFNMDYFEVTLIQDDLPTVSITSPVDGDSFTEGENVLVIVEATDDIGIVQVELFNGLSSLGVDDTAPYEFQLDNIALGTYELTAVASDGVNLPVTSEVVNIEVTTNEPPVVVLPNDLNIAAGALASTAITVNDENDAATVTLVLYDKSNATGSTNNPITPSTIVPDTEYTFANQGGGSYQFDWQTTTTAGRSYLVEVTADDGVNPAVVEYFSVNVAQAIPATILARTFSNPLPWYGGNPQSPFTVAIETTPVQNIGWIEAGEFVEYLIDVPEAGPYNVEFFAGKGNGGTFTVTLSEENDGGGFNAIGSFDATQTGWQNYVAYPFQVEFTNPGVQTLRLDFSGAGGVNIRDFIFTLPVVDTTPPVITLLGDDPVNLVVGHTYIEPGATALDDVDGDITNQIVIDNSALNTAVAGTYQVTYNVSDIAGNTATEVVRTVMVAEPELPLACENTLYRINVGGGALAAADDSDPDWAVDNAGAPSAFRVAGSNNIFTNNGATIDLTDPTVPAFAPEAIFKTERFDLGSAPNMKWEFPVEAGTEVQVTLFFAEIFNGITAAGQRVFDVEIEGTVLPAFDNIDPYSIAGSLGAFSRSATLTVQDGTLDIEFFGVIENPALKGIQICGIPPANEPPVLTISAPLDGANVTRGDDITLTGMASDPEDGDISANIFWDSDDIQFDPNPNNATGASITAKFVTPGPQNLIATITDSNGAEVSEQLTVNVSAPSVTITSPTEGSGLNQGDLTLEWTSMDVLFDLIEHFHIYVNPPDVNNIDPDTRISTASVPGQEFWVIPADLLQVGDNTIVIRIANQFHEEFTNTEAEDIVNFEIYPELQLADLSDITQGNDQGQCGANITLPAPTVINAVGNVTVTTDVGDGPGTDFAFPVGETTVNYQASDDITGQVVTASITVTVNDTEAPLVTCPTAIIVEVAPGVEATVVTYNTPGVTDNCPGGVVEQTQGLPSGSNFPVGTTVNIFEATDASGNTSDCSFSVTVVEQAPLLITGLDNIVQSNDAGVCGASIVLPIPTIVNGVGNVTVTTDVGEGPGTSFLFPVGTTTVNYEATDDGTGQTAMASIMVTVDDTEAPVITCPSDITVDVAPGVTSSVVTYEVPIPTDNCPGVMVVQSQGLPSGSNFPVGTTVNIFEATDASGNTSTCSFSVTVAEQAPLLITGLDNIVQSNDAGVCGASIVLPIPTIVNGVGNVTVTTDVGEGPGTSFLFPVGTTTVNYEATDDGTGQTAMASITVTVDDTEAPVITCPSDITVDVAPGVTSSVVTYEVPIPTDNCPGVTVLQSQGLPSGSNFPVGTTVNIFEATDASGNTSDCSFSVTVVEQAPLLITGLDNIVQSNDAGVCGASIVLPIPTIVNGVGNVTVTTDVGEGPGTSFLFPDGTTTVNYEATDDGTGQVAQASISVTVTDTESPTITCPANITVGVESGVQSTVVTYETPAFADNCPGAVLMQTAGLPSGANFPLGTTTNTFAVTDASGNINTCSFTVTVTEQQELLITGLEDIIQGNDEGECGATVELPIPTIVNGVGNITITTSVGDGPGSSFFFRRGSASVTYRASDDATGQTAEATITITIVDEELPSISCPANIVVQAESGMSSAVVTFNNPIFSDNCPRATFIQSGGLPSGSSFPVGTTTVTFQAIDASGNTSTCSFDVTVTQQTFQDCGDCSGGITTLTLEYLGDEEPGDILVIGRKPGRFKLWYQDFEDIGNGDQFTIETSAEKLGSRIWIVSKYRKPFVIYTSCALDLYADMTLGDYRIVSGASKNGGALCTKPASVSAVTGFNLVKTNNGKGSQSMTDGEVIDLSGGNEFSIEAVTNLREVSSVVFTLNGEQVVVDNKAIYTLSKKSWWYPGKGNKVAPYYFEDGAYTLTATPYEDEGGYGASGAPLTINFTVVNSGQERSHHNTREITDAEIEDEVVDQPVFLTPELSLNTYPNPFRESLAINFSPAESGKVEVAIYSLSGVKVAQIFEGEVEVGKQYQWKYKPDSNLAQGVLLLHIVGQDTEVFERIVYTR